MTVLLLILVLGSFFSATIVLSTLVLSAAASRLEEDSPNSQHQIFILRSTENMSAAANPGVYDQLLS